MNAQSKLNKEAGWEFTLPGFLFKPLNWLFAFLIMIVLILSFVLVTKVTNKQNDAQTVTTQSP